MFQHQLLMLLFAGNAFPKASSLDGACGIRDFVAPMFLIPLYSIRATIYFQNPMCFTLFSTSGTNRFFLLEHD